MAIEKKTAWGAHDYHERKSNLSGDRYNRIKAYLGEENLVDEICAGYNQFAIYHHSGRTVIVSQKVRELDEIKPNGPINEWLNVTVAGDDIQGICHEMSKDLKALLDEAPAEN